MTVPRWHIKFCVVNTERLKHISLRIGKRQKKAFIFPIDSLFNSLLCFDEMHYCCVCIVGALWRKRTSSGLYGNSFFLLWNMTNYFLKNTSRAVAFLMKTNIKKAHFKNVSLFCFTLPKILWNGKTSRPSVWAGGSVVSRFSPLNRNILFLYNFNFINWVSFFRLNAVLCDIYVALIFICRPVKWL
jgi:hypothetical protein